jgi:hypothetical protein
VCTGVTFREASDTGCGRIPREPRRPATRQRAPGRPRHRAQTRAPTYSRTTPGQGLSPACGQLSLLIQERAYGTRGCSGPRRTAGPPATYGTPDPPPPRPRRRHRRRLDPVGRSAHAVYATDGPQHQPPARPIQAARDRPHQEQRPREPDAPGTKHTAAPTGQSTAQTARRRTPTAPSTTADPQQSDTSQKPPNTRGHTLSMVELREPGPLDRAMITTTGTGSSPSPIGRLRRALTTHPPPRKPWQLSGGTSELAAQRTGPDSEFDKVHLAIVSVTVRPDRSGRQRDENPEAPSTWESRQARRHAAYGVDRFHASEG